MKNLLIIDLHCDALLPSGVGEFGGGNTYSKSVIATIANTDIKCLYITRKKIQSLPDEEKISSNITYIRIETSQNEVEDKDTLFQYSDEILSRILKLIAEYQFSPELIHSMYWSSGIVAQKLSTLWNIPFIHTILSNGKRKQIQSGNYDIADIRIKFEDEIFKSAKYIICSSTYELEDVKKLYNIPKEKLILTGLEVDCAFKNPSYNSSGEYQLSSLLQKKVPYISIDRASHTEPSLWWNKGAFLYYGRIHSDKGIIQIINSWLKLKSKYSDFPMLWIAGGSPEQIYNLRKNIAFQDKLTLCETAQDIIWWGRLSPAGLSCLMLKSLALVTHSRYESGGLMILEAMAQGIPVIATPFGYAHDYIQNWKNGFIVPFNDCAQLERRMLHFYYQPFLSSVLGQNAKTLFNKLEKEFNFGDKHLALYQGDYRKESNIETNNFNKAECLPYPLTEYLPSDEEVLTFLLQYMQNNSWNNNTVPILKSSKDYKKYHIWIIHYGTQDYECFRWKTFINEERIFINTKEFFYHSSSLIKTDNLLYEVKGCTRPINMPLDYKITIYPINFEKISFHKIQTNFDILFKSIVQINQKVSIIDFFKMADDSKKIVCSYGYHLQDSLVNIYHFLMSAHLQTEELGILPKTLDKHTFVDNYFAHIGEICLGPKSYFYALWLVNNNYISTLYIHDFIEKYIEDKNIQKNVLLWLLNLKFKYIAETIVSDDVRDTLDMDDIQKIINLLK